LEIPGGKADMAKLFAEFDRIEENMQQLVTAVGECLEKSLESVCKYLAEGETEEVKRLTETVHGKKARPMITAGK